MRLTRFLAAKWRRERDSNPCGRVPKRFSRPPRYDHFDIPPYMNCRQAEIIGYSIFLEIFLEMLFSVAFGVPEKSVFTRLFRVFATVMLANFQDRLVMTASICLQASKNMQDEQESSIRFLLWRLMLKYYITKAQACQYVSTKYLSTFIPFIPWHRLS